MMPEIVNIVSAESAGDLCLRLRFDDGTEQVVDFRPFLSRALHPSIRAYLEPARFASFRIEQGDLVWGDWELCFPIADLYHNRLEKTAALDEAA
ncbi:MAG: DUF2442 domain-containing protein [Rhodocyclaceae bacterium]|nr:DUF2442 domain-containing protein [Rhodocyclaceae bacterium]